MTLLAIKLFLGGWLRRIFGFIADHPWQALCIALVALSAFLWLRADRIAGQRDRAMATVASERTAHKQTVLNYRAASNRAQEAAKANVARVKKEQEQINERHVEALEERLAVGQSRYDRLRAQSEAYSRSSSEAGMSAASEAACQAHAGTSCEAIPALLKAAQDNTDTLIELQAWAKDQGGVRVSP